MPGLAQSREIRAEIAVWRGGRHFPSKRAGLYNWHKDRSICHWEFRIPELYVSETVTPPTPPPTKRGAFFGGHV